MPNYDFKQLSPHDFEQLTRDLIQARDDFILESLKTGRDLGRRTRIEFQGHHPAVSGL